VPKEGSFAATMGQGTGVSINAERGKEFNDSFPRIFHPDGKSIVFHMPFGSHLIGSHFGYFEADGPVCVQLT